MPDLTATDASVRPNRYDANMTSNTKSIKRLKYGRFMIQKGLRVIQSISTLDLVVTYTT